MTTIIAEEYRGGNLENKHEGAICVLDKNKEVIYSKGEIENTPIFYRSAMKPIQAIPAFDINIEEKYSLSSDEMALFCASQRGENYHQRSLSSLIKKLGLKEESLICGESYPLNEQPKIEYICRGKKKRKLLHNCSGKHLGFLAYSREVGLNTKDYGEVNHPLQERIKEEVELLSEYPKEKMAVGKDGCGVPVFGVPLRNMALSYLKFVNPDLVSDKNKRDTLNQISNTMQANPEIVASHDFICTVLLKDKNIIAKGGAQGVYCLALKDEKISIALKVLSGTELLWPLLVAEILEEINYRNKRTIENLYQLRSSKILSDAREVVGETKIIL
ncbi:asparaginase [Virgibacillus indicus]|uniref:Asparaginase n=1 Tax=Virgibacillus indicus TaxID=2024554 RepID=A0A265N5W0_9BACI|nr:asparaginase [Virgibacillus indicus]OZU87171.1 asparaginase [Virgibacillus indicus]